MAGNNEKSSHKRLYSVETLGYLASWGLGEAADGFYSMKCISEWILPWDGYMGWSGSYFFYLYNLLQNEIDTSKIRQSDEVYNNCQFHVASFPVILLCEG